jgi:hypothetical protein
MARSLDNGSKSKYYSSNFKVFFEIVHKDKPGLEHIKCLALLFDDLKGKNGIVVEAHSQGLQYHRFVLAVANLLFVTF